MHEKFVLTVPRHSPRKPRFVLVATWCERARSRGVSFEVLLYSRDASGSGSAFSANLRTVDLCATAKVMSYLAFYVAGSLGRVGSFSEERST